MTSVVEMVEAVVPKVTECLCSGTIRSDEIGSCIQA